MPPVGGKSHHHTTAAKDNKKTANGTKSASGNHTSATVVSLVGSGASPNLAEPLDKNPLSDSISMKMSMSLDEKAESESGKSDRFYFAAPPGSVGGTDCEQRMLEIDRSRGPTPSNDDDDRMSVSSRLSTRSQRASQKLSNEGFERSLSYIPESSSSQNENKLNLSMVPVISDQLLHDIVNKERTIEQIDVHLFVKKCLDLLAAKNAAEAKVEQLRQKNAELEVENRNIRESKVRMQVKVEQEEEYISNMLLKRIQRLKSDKEQLAQKYEQEEEHLTNDLMRKLTQLEGERDQLASKLSQDQSWVVGNLLVKIRRLEAEIQNNQKSLDQLRREKVDLENSLEHEQEALFNTLGKRMDTLEAEKRRLQQRIENLEAAAIARGEGSPAAAVVAAIVAESSSSSPAPDNNNNNNDKNTSIKDNNPATRPPQPQLRE